MASTFGRGQLAVPPHSKLTRGKAVGRTAFIQCVAPARTSVSRHVDATSSRRASSGLRLFASTMRMLPEKFRATWGNSRASVVVLPWPSPGLVKSTSCDLPCGSCWTILHAVAA